eukprot:2601488-Amphidinium_carterae.1
MGHQEGVGLGKGFKIIAALRATRLHISKFSTGKHTLAYHHSTTFKTRKINRYSWRNKDRGEKEHENKRAEMGKERKRL